MAEDKHDDRLPITNSFKKKKKKKNYTPPQDDTNAL